jgi:hypothetical protein
VATSRVAANVGAAVVLASLLVACDLLAGASPQRTQPQFCNGISAGIDGCDNPPQYEGTTCAALAAEWGRVVNERVAAVIQGPAVVDDSQRSARIQRTLVLATVTLSTHMDQNGLLGECSAAEILSGARPEFSDELQAGIGSALYDDNPPATWEQFNAEALRGLSVLDFPVAT